MREPVITVSSMKAGHGQKVFRDMVGQALPTLRSVEPAAQDLVNP
jgi:hypothetical protein